MHFPFITTGITLLQIILFLTSDSKTLLLLRYEHDNFSQIWRLIAHMFVDTSPIHITSNLLGQTVLGSLLENNHAPWKVALIYFGGGILGALSSSFLEKSASLVGASAALFALGFSCVAEMQIGYHGSARYRQVRLLGMLYLLLVDAWGVFVDNVAGTTLAVHCFGAIGGYLLGCALFVSDLNKDEGAQHRTYQVVGYLYYMFFLVLLLVLNLFFV